MSSVWVTGASRYLEELTNTAPELIFVYAIVATVGVVGAAFVLAFTWRDRIGAAWVKLTRNKATTQAPPTDTDAPAVRLSMPAQRVLTAGFTLVACLPAGIYAAALPTWWNASAPTVTEAVITVVVTVVAALTVWGLSRVLPPSPLRLATLTAGLSWAVLAVDGFSGVPVQQRSIFSSAIHTDASAGFTDIPVALFVTCATIFAWAVSGTLRTHGHRTLGLSAIAGVGTLSAVVVSLGMFGNSLSSLAAVVPAFGLLFFFYLFAHTTWNRRGLATALVADILGSLAFNIPLGTATIVVIAVWGTAVLAGAWCAEMNAPSPVLANAESAEIGATGPVSTTSSGAVAGSGFTVFLRRMPATITALGGGLLVAVLIGTVATPSSVATAGDVARDYHTSLVPSTSENPVVVIGTEGLRWADVTETAAPTLWKLIEDGGVTGGVTVGASDTNRRCGAAGWLSLSAGRSPVAGELVNGRWACTPWMIASAARSGSTSLGAADVVGWSGLVALQNQSEFGPELGVLGDTIAESGECATAIGPGAGLALADAEGHIARYRNLSDALETPTESFQCPVTMVDVGASPYHPVPITSPGTTAEGEARVASVRALDAAVRRVLDAAPSTATIIVSDVGNPSLAQPALGVGIVVTATDQSTPHFLSAASTRWEGTIRLLDIPTTLVSALGVAYPTSFSGAPLVAAGERPSDVAETVAQLTALTDRHQDLRGISVYVTMVPLYLALALLVFIVLGLPWLTRRTPAGAAVARKVTDTTLLVLSAVPVGLLLMTAWQWWQFDATKVVLWLALIISTLAVAGLGALIPRRPIWAAPALISAVTFVILTLDAILGTPLHRGSPLGPAPTLGGRYYGFGNPTYSVYLVAAVVLAAACATWLIQRGQRALAIVASAAIGVITFVVDLWPTLGADFGGGLVIIPTFAIIVLTVASIRVTWQRLAVIGVVGVVCVAGFSILDWLRPTEQRSHLGAFVQSVVDGTALETIFRKAGYAAATVANGFPAWLTMALIIALAVVLWQRNQPVPRWLTGVAQRWPMVTRPPTWLSRTESQWPLLRVTLLSLLIAAIAGALVNDYGVRIATIMFFAGAPLLGLLVLRSTDGIEAEQGPPTLTGREREREHRGSTDKQATAP